MRESQHGHLKRVVAQSLLLRGGVDFDTLDAYRAWIADLIGRRNARRGKMVRLECAALRPLPPARTTDYDEATVFVSCCARSTLAGVIRRVSARGSGTRWSRRLKLLSGILLTPKLPVTGCNRLHVCLVPLLLETHQCRAIGGRDRGRHELLARSPLPDPRERRVKLRAARLPPPFR